MNVYMPPDEETQAAMNKLVHGGHPVHETHMENHLAAQSEASYTPPEPEVLAAPEEPETVEEPEKKGLFSRIVDKLKGE